MDGLPTPPPDFESVVARIVEENIATGRFKRAASWRSKAHPLSLEQYVDRVILNVCREFKRNQALVDGDSHEWELLAQYLYERACRTIRRLRPDTDVSSNARDFSQQACLTIYHQRYPFDVSFEAWATTILNNLILAHYTRSPDAMDQFVLPYSLDEAVTPKERSANLPDQVSPDPQSPASLENIDNQMVLRNAIDQLRSPTQRKVIIATYFEDLDDAQIAKRLRKTKQAIYNLRNRALSRLKVLLGDETNTRIWRRNPSDNIRGDSR